MLAFSIQAEVITQPESVLLHHPVTY